MKSKSSKSQQNWRVSIGKAAEAERAKVEAAAESAGLSVSNYFRRLAGLETLDRGRPWPKKPA